MTLLAGITSPADVKALAPAQLDLLAAEIREHLVASVSRTGGHLGPNLGVVELTIALHRVFDSPRDVLLWDTGHQAYVHKMLTGRAHAFGGLRRAGGLSGYPSRSESEHDVIENSHASTALSYADGFAKAFALRGETGRAVIAVVGDGALTGGMCWEALNNLSRRNNPVVIVVNDNGRSYAPTVGGLADHLAALRSPGGRCRPTLFDALGLSYVGPVDGHDVAAVESALRVARRRGGPVVVHCVTRKGHGYPPAEQDSADCMHGVGALDPATGRPLSTGSALPWTQVFAEEMVAVGRERPDVVAITAAMLRPVGLHAFAEVFPERVFDVGIAEQHAVASAAGLASAGLHPVVCVYATFLNRAFDQVLMDVALHRLPVTFVLDRAGVTGDDGASHHGMWDLAAVSAVPGVRAAAPRDAGQLRELLRAAVADDSGPTVVRFPKAQAGDDLPAIGRIGRADVLRAHLDSSVLIIAVGPLAAEASAAAEQLAADGIHATVVDPRWVMPVDDALSELAASYDVVVTVEDGVVAGGVGDALARELRARSDPPRVVTLGLPTRFVPHGSRSAILASAGLDADGVAVSVRHALAVDDAQPKRRASVR